MRGYESYSMTEPIHFVCVLRTGGDYNHRYVNNLYNAIAANVTVPFTFTCITNSVTGLHGRIRTVPFQHNWPGWWSKIEMFRPGIFESGRVWYFDLDTLIVQNIDAMVSSPSLGRRFCALSDFLVPNRAASGVMSWIANDPDVAKIYTEFALKPERVMTSCSTLGDQCWIGISSPQVTFLQNLFAGHFASFKRECSNGTKPQAARVICFHGRPRPHEAIREPAFAWVRSYWK